MGKVIIKQYYENLSLAGKIVMTVMIPIFALVAGIEHIMIIRFDVTKR